ncbi:PKD domain-containing protein [Candidatus Gracilibacteria bacterium]|nr:PKD domain-containing protein [Candidatus Gracilibacteria bacterium]
MKKLLFFCVLSCLFSNLAQAASVYSVVKGKVATFKANSPNATNFEWTFPDGETKYGPTVEHIFNKTGKNEVTLKVSSGTRENTVKKPIYVTNDGIPTAILKVSVDGKDTLSKTIYITADQTINFSSESFDKEGQTKNVNISWIVNGQSYTSEQLPYAITKAGKYSIKLIASQKGESNSKDEETVTVIMENTPPKITSIKFKKDPTLGALSVTVSVDANDIDGKIEQYRFEVIENASTKFAQITTVDNAIFNLSQTAGKHYYTFKVTIVDNSGGQTVKISDNVLEVTSNMENATPTAYIQVSPSNLGNLDTTFLFYGKGSDDDNDYLQYEWTFPNGEQKFTQNVSKKFTETGKVTVKLKVSDGIDETEASMDITISEDKTTGETTATEGNQAPTAQIRENKTIGNTSTLFSFYLDATDPDNDYLSYVWDMGDGGKMYIQNVAYKYATPGTYTVNVKVSDGELVTEDNITIKVEETDSTDKIDELNKPITEKKTDENLPPIIKINEIQKQGDTNTLFRFLLNTSDPNNDNLDFVWIMGDGFKSYGQSSSHKYDKPGTYTVTANVSDGELTAKDSISITVTEVDPNAPPPEENLAPIIQINESNNKGSINTVFRFFPETTDPNNDYLVYSWDMGDGGKLYIKNASYKYSEPGIYTVNVTVSDGEFTATDTVSITIIDTIETINKLNESIANKRAQLNNETDPEKYKILSKELDQLEKELAPLLAIETTSQKENISQGDLLQLGIVSSEKMIDSYDPFSSPLKDILENTLKEKQEQLSASKTTEEQNALQAEIDELNKSLEKISETPFSLKAESIKGTIQALKKDKEDLLKMFQEESNPEARKEIQQKINAIDNEIKTLEIVASELNSSAIKNKISELNGLIKEKEFQLATETDPAKYQSLLDEIAQIESELKPLVNNQNSNTTPSTLKKQSQILEQLKTKKEAELNKETNPEKRKQLLKELDQINEELGLNKKLTSFMKKGLDSLIEIQLKEVLEKKQANLENETDPEKRRLLQEEINQINEELKKLGSNPFFAKNEWSKERLEFIRNQKLKELEKETDPEKQRLLQLQLDQIDIQLSNIESNPDPENDAFVFADITGTVNTKFFFYGRLQHSSDKPLFFEWEVGREIKRSGQNITLQFKREGLHTLRLTVSDGISTISDSLIIKIQEKNY